MSASRSIALALTSFWLSIMSMMSPGISRTEVKTMMLAKISVGISARMRLRM